MKIKAYTNFENETKTHYYTNFEVVEELPKINDIYYEDDSQIEIIKDIKQVNLDCEQGNDEVYKYNFYKVIISNKEKDFDGIEEETEEYICVRKNEN